MKQGSSRGGSGSLFVNYRFKMEGTGRQKTLSCYELGTDYKPTGNTCTTDNGGRFNVSGLVVGLSAEKRMAGAEEIHSFKLTIQDPMPNENGEVVNRVYQSTFTSIGKAMVQNIYSAVVQVDEEAKLEGGVNMTFDFYTNKGGWAAAFATQNDEKIEWAIPFDKQKEMSKDDWVRCANKAGELLKALQDQKPTPVEVEPVEVEPVEVEPVEETEDLPF
ncbi:MAG: hypothetical protein MK076_00200 [Flavobacteriales bacterium]|nr:hypothetical protein [Flavobacteriales bacterium]